MSDHLERIRMERTLAVIPAKGTSKRIPGKNTRNFHGYPMLAYAIRLAQASGLFDEVLVSTERHEVGALARSYGATFMLRDPKLAEVDAPDCGTQAVTQDALLWHIANTGKDVDYVCCLYPCVPFLTPYSLASGFDIVRHPKSMYVRTARVEETIGDVIDAGQYYWGRAACFADLIPLEKHTVDVSPPDHAVDINTPEDWNAAWRAYEDRCWICRHNKVIHEGELL